MNELNLKDPLIRCEWCGWKGNIPDLETNEHGEPAYCPECGHGTFDIRVERKENEQ